MYCTIAAALWIGKRLSHPPPPSFVKILPISILGQHPFKVPCPFSLNDHLAWLTDYLLFDDMVAFADILLVALVGTGTYHRTCSYWWHLLRTSKPWRWIEQIVHASEIHLNMKPSIVWSSFRLIIKVSLSKFTISLMVQSRSVYYVTLTPGFKFSSPFGSGLMDAHTRV